MIPLYDDTNSDRVPFQTLLLIAINIYVFYLELTTQNFSGLLANYALIPIFVDWAALPTLVPFMTAIFLHGGLLHIGANMLFLWVFGNNVEAKLGWSYIPLYLLGGLAGNYFQYLADTTSPLPIIGASGAVAAILGAYLVFFPHHKIKTLLPLFIFFIFVNIPAWAMLAYWFILQFISGLASIGDVSTQMSGGIAYIAHAGGFAVGLAVALTTYLSLGKTKRLVRAERL
jgi:membrane associated rhomboid family serine protease